MITKLKHHDERIAKQIWCVSQRSYSVEAELIGREDFPPLSRTVADIKAAKSDFYGYVESDDVAAVIEIEMTELHLEIHSLVVDPNHFRKGIADKLMCFVLSELHITSAWVETAVVNEPAIRLYRKHGFVEIERFTPPHGIKKLALLYSSS
ncbi:MULTISPECIES: GNAT family N-acetyltransferase [Pseudoalteromonas]|uniref:GNAT family N-acetyltransferase n=1 Tax=Pseudoalteromonas amylolytica TaxID=1859457 RepID=A0A1S1MW33_9GAMM|nr:MULTISPECIES: N-acetyltransferase [Pseudoalteromonas]MCF6436920.1 GNAT family N-acetyltransferase [Pseudoalteromonas sp. MMG022]OHU85043.1 GNAT family N-acetyltransferase [Pseudoalteromonas sp. JW3]OHU90005.1 GNAT family N-acetyltransferase [Pseudoalteromonas amylolytica]